MKDLRIVLSLGAAMLACAGGAAAASSAPNPPRNTPMVQDWSTEQAAFRKPETPEEARAHGRFERWQRLASDPRFMLALAHRLREEADAKDQANPSAAGVRRPRAANEISRDWSNVIGGGLDGAGGHGVAGVYPAKFSFDINSPPSCIFDFVVFPTGDPGATAIGTREFWGSSFTNPHSRGTLTIGKYPPRQVTIVTSTTRNDAKFAQTGGPDVTSANTTAANVAAAINRWNGQTGFSAEAITNQVHITLDSNGNSLDDMVSENLSNFGPLVHTDGVDSPSMPSIIAFNQLYDGTCASSRRNALSPNVLFSYDTGGAIRTSPVLSYSDFGRQLAFVQSSGGQAELVLLKWQDNANGLDAARPKTPATAANASEYRAESGACSSQNGCMFKIPLGANDFYSSPFVDYSGDTLYVGTNDGVLHKITGVFSGLPAEVVTGGFPAVVSAGNALSSPVYNFNGSAFVGSASVPGSGGALHRVDVNTGAVTSSAKLTFDPADNPGLRDSPILDVSTGRVYAFIFNDGGVVGTNCNFAPCRAIVELATNFPAGAPGNKVLIGSAVGNTGFGVQYHGSFDAAWRASSDSTGSIYVCGGAPETAGQSVVWKVPIIAGTLGTPIRGPAVSGLVGASCSPITILKNGANERIFLSMSANGEDGVAGAICNGSCVYMINLNALAPDVQEQWSFEFNGNQIVGGGTFVVEGTTITAGGAQGCPIFDIGGSALADATRLAACINTVPGYTAVQRVRRITVTRNAFGDVPDSTVHEGIDMVNFAERLQDHVNGSASEAWGPTIIPAAGIEAIGGTGGIIIDNISNQPGASSIYYVNLGPATGNATQVSQSDLD